MVKLTGIFSQLNRRRILVVGDFMLDSYTIGKARRISPEAPVAIVHVQKQEHRPGGAGNVAVNLTALGADVIAIGRIGKDHDGDKLLFSLEQEGIDTSGIYVENRYMTPVKNRILADNQQIVRIDHEIVTPLSPEIESHIITEIPNLLDGVELVAISDYGKGLLTRKLLQALISSARRKNIPIISDPKGVDFTKYQGSTILKPNLGEAYAAANLPLDSSLEEVAKRLHTNVDIEMLMVTRSEAGISVFQKDGSRSDYPVKIRELKDVTGAGDTVLAMLSYALANRLSLDVAVRLANLAAGMAIERFGCARITSAELAKRLLDEDVSNKVFDEQHLSALKEVLSNTKYVLLSISGDLGMTSTIFSAIRQLSRGENRELILFIRDLEPDPEFINLLASLHDVDFILLKSNDMRQFCEQLCPEEILSIEGNNIKQVEKVTS